MGKLRVRNVPGIPLIDDLLNEPAPPGSIFLVEYDPASQWFAAFGTIIAGWIQGGGTAAYVATSSRLIDCGRNSNA
jgi:hypothetical protein